MLIIDVGLLLILFLSTFALEMVTLWATREISGVKLKFKRILLGASITSLTFCVILTIFQLFSESLNIQTGIFLAFFVMCFSTVTIFFRTADALRMVKLVFYRIVLTMAAGGCATVFEMFFKNNIASYIAAIVAVLFIAEAGWGIVHRSFISSDNFVRLDVRFGNTYFKVKALMDTGNRLKDPVTGFPVVIVEYKAMKDILPEGMDAVFKNQMNFSEFDPTELYEITSGSNWAKRFCVVPYSVIGRDKGIMIGFRPDEISVEWKKKRYSTDHAVICVNNGNASFCENGSYNALLNPDLMSCMF